MDKIGIIILHFGNLHYTFNLVKSILNSKYQNFEILIIDNGSKTFKRDKFLEFEKITYLELDSNLGFAAGINSGLMYFRNRTDYFLILNNDCILKPNTLDAFLTAGSSNPNSILAPVIYKLGTETAIEFGGVLEFSKMYFKDLPQVPKEFTEVSYLTGACLFFSKDCFEKIGFLPEEYFMYSEDMDYSIMANLKQIKLFVLPSAKIYHEKGASSGGLGAFTVYYIHRNRFLLARKYLNGFSYFHFLVYYNILIFIKLIFWSFKKFGLVKWFFLGYLDGLKNKKGKSDRFP
jgi:GT2 family glycosyltransferase